MKLKCLIVDDESLALDILENYINRLDNLELVGRCENAVEAYNLLQKQIIDLLFLDIQMPKLTGIDFLKSLPNAPKVVFTTAYRDYALEGYELNVLDYLLKPISFERFLKAVNKMYEYQATPESQSIVTQVAATNDYQDVFVYLKADKKMIKVLLKDILYIESLKDYVRVKTTQKEIVTYQKISYLEEKLPSEMFVRVHRSFIVSLPQVVSFSATVVGVGEYEIPIGRNYKNEVLKILNKDNFLDEN